MRKTAIIYGRVSTARQAADELPIAGQLEHGHSKAAELDADVLRVFTDPGISGREEDRPGFQEAIHFCEENNVDFFITWSPSRFARDHVVAGLYKRRLEKKKVRVVYCTLDIDRSQNSGYIIDSFTAIMDEIYSRQIAADTKRSLIKNARDGFRNGGRAPFGYRSIPSPKNPRRRTLEIVADEAWLVLQMYTWRAAGQGVRAIAERLNKAGYTLRGRRWTQSTVYNILRSSVVQGMTTFNRRSDGGHGIENDPSQWVIVQTHEAIVPDDIVARARAMMKDAAPTSPGSTLSTHYFTGLARCGHCGAAMVIETAKGRSRRHSYYNCNTWRKTGECRAHRRPAEQLDAFLLDTIMTKVFTPDALQAAAVELNAECGRWATERREKIRATELQLTDLNRRKANLFAVLELHGREAPNLGDLTQRLRDITEKTKRLTLQLSELENQRAPTFAADDAELTAIRDVLREIVTDRSDIKRTRALMQQLIESVVLLSDRVEINYRTDLLSGSARKEVVHSSDEWLGDVDSNHDRQSQSLQSYH